MTFEFPSFPENKRRLTGKSFWWSPVSLHSLQKNEFNQWYIMLHNSVSSERVQWLLQQLIQVLRDTVPADRWRGFQFIPKNVELVEGPVTPWGQMPSQIECHLQYK